MFEYLLKMFYSFDAKLIAVTNQFNPSLEDLYLGVGLLINWLLGLDGGELV